MTIQIIIQGYLPLFIDVDDLAWQKPTDRFQNIIKSIVSAANNFHPHYNRLLLETGHTKIVVVLDPFESTTIMGNANDFMDTDYTVLLHYDFEE